MNLKSMSALLLLCISALTGCEAPIADSTHEVKRCRSGGEYMVVEFTEVEAELMHPTAKPEVDKYLLKLPLPEKETTFDQGVPLATLVVKNGALAFDAFEGEGAPPPMTYHRVVHRSAPISNAGPKLEFRVALVQFQQGRWQLAIGKKQYSRRQLGIDLHELGAVEAIDIPLTEQAGWYRYAEAPFELRKGKHIADQLLVFKARTKR